jgi:hypothetical protein
VRGVQKARKWVECYLLVLLGKRGAEKSRRGRATRRQRGGGRQELEWPWHSWKRTAGEGSRTGEGGVGPGATGLGT